MNQRNSTDGAPTSKGAGKNLPAWLSFFGVLITAAISGYNANTANDIRKTQSQIEIAQQANQHNLAELQTNSIVAINTLRSQLEKKNQDLSRIRFVSEILPRVLNGSEKESRTFIPVIEMILTEEEFRQLAKALINSPDDEISQLGESVGKTISIKQINDIEKINSVFSNIYSDDKPKRLSTMDTLYNEFIGNPALISYAIDYLTNENRDIITVEGRINALFLLKNARESAWRAEQIDHALDAVAMVRAEAGKRDPALGTQTLSVLDEVSSRLTEIAQRIPGE